MFERNAFDPESSKRPRLVPIRKFGGDIVFAFGLAEDEPVGAVNEAGVGALVRLITSLRSQRVVDRAFVAPAFDRHRHAEGQGLLALLDAPAAVDPAEEGVDRTKVELPSHALEPSQELIAAGVIPET